MQHIQKLRHDHAEKEIAGFISDYDVTLSGDLTPGGKKSANFNQDEISKLLKHFPILNQALHPRKIQRLFLL